MKMRAAIFVEPKKPLVVDEVEIDPPGEGEALVKLTATGVCHTDWYMAGKIRVDDFISRTLALAQIDSAFEYMERAEGVRSVVLF